MLRWTHHHLVEVQAVAVAVAQAQVLALAWQGLRGFQSSIAVHWILYAESQRRCILDGGWRPLSKGLGLLKMLHSAAVAPHV